MGDKGSDFNELVVIDVRIVLTLTRSPCSLQKVACPGQRTQGKIAMEAQIRVMPAHATELSILNSRQRLCRFGPLRSYMSPNAYYAQGP